MNAVALRETPRDFRARRTGRGCRSAARFRFRASGFTPLPPGCPSLQAGPVRNGVSNGVGEEGGIQKVKEKPRLLGRVVTGFTLVESVIVLGIIVLIASFLLVGFPSFSQRINLQRASQRLALSLRKAQNMSLAVRQLELPSGVRTVPPAFGIYIDQASTPTSYFIFADLRPSDQLYDPGDDIVVETITLEPGIAFDELVSDLGGGEVVRDVLNIVFTVPEARMEIRSTDTETVGESAELILTSRAGDVRSVVVRTSGQIQVKR